ncbi:PAS domain S-box protein [Tsukamurella tyrosinosolvens]|nr:PAS domain S-box protein [Tsukamurella tyrosinosolvens]
MCSAAPTSRSCGRNVRQQGRDDAASGFRSCGFVPNDRRSAVVRPDSLLTDALYRQVFLRAGLPMALHSADRRFLHANDAMVELLGYSLEELQVMTVMDVVHPEA